MKKAVLILLVLAIAIACRNTNNASENTSTLPDTNVKSVINTVQPEIIVKDSIVKINEVDEKQINYLDSIDFEKFPTEVRKRTSAAAIDWTSYPEAKVFKTRITEAYKSTEVGFAGYYVLATFGCGTSCVMGYMVDVRDGKIYDLPLGEENSCLFAEDRIVCNSQSRLFISGICKENLEAKKVFYKGYLWDEDKKEFSTVNEDQFVKKNKQ